MRVKRLFSLLLCLTVLCLCAAPAALAAEEGEIRETRHLRSVEDLRKLAEDCRLDSYSRGLLVVLDADLDLSGETIYPIPTFGGVFDGDGHSITGLSLSTDGSHQGLFRYIQEGGQVKDLKLSGEIAPQNGRCQLGGLAGTNYGTVTNCSFSGSVSGLNYVGGLVGENYGTVRGCSVSGTVDGKRMTGGIAGYNEGLIADCRNEARVNTSISEGALQLEDLRVTALNAVELTNAEDEDVVSDSGGVVGLSKGIVQNCVNAGTVGYPHFGYNVGGIAGRQSGYLTGCENRGEIFGRKDVGGIVGQMEPFLLLKESVNLAEELALLNYKMNLASGTLGDMSDEMKAALDGVDWDSGSLGDKIGEGGSISPVGGESGGSISPAGGGSISPAGGGDADQGQENGSDSGSADADDLRDRASGLAEVYYIMAENGAELSDELTDANDQLSRVLMLMGNALNGAANRQIFEDVSDQLPEDDVEGRVSHCVNHAPVEGDKNVGGVIGDMGIEYEFDMESQLPEVLGLEGIVSNTYETKCVSSDNVNHGSVSARKDGAGGVAGTQELGSILRCEGYGSVGSSDGSYVGGVVGLSRGVVRESWAMCNLSGTEYVGGIAGYATTLADCGSMVGLADVTACSGAIAGWADMDGESVTGNVFVHESLGAVDGISYDGKAVPLSYEELLRREGLPEQFRTLKLSFVADGVVLREIEFEYGGSIDPAEIPAVPEKEGCTGAWPAYDYSDLTFSAVIEAVYTPREGALASKATREDSPMSIVLIEGDFDSSTEALLSKFQGTPMEPESGVVLESWVMHLTRLEEGQTYSLRFLPPQVERGHQVELYVLSQGQWSKVDAEKAGSYLSFDCDSSTVVFCAVDVQTGRLGTVIGVCAAAAAALGLGLFLLNRRKKKAPAKAEESES